MWVFVWEGFFLGQSLYQYYFKKLLVILLLLVIVHELFHYMCHFLLKSFILNIYSYINRRINKFLNVNFIFLRYFFRINQWSFMRWKNSLHNKHDREFDSRIDVRSSERKGKERGQATTRTEIDASRRKRDFPTNTRYKNSEVIPRPTIIYITTRCASIFFPIWRFFWKRKKKEKISLFLTLKKEKKKEKEQEERVQRSTSGSVNCIFIFSSRGRQVDAVTEWPTA